MSFDQTVALFSALISFAGWLLVIVQLRDNTDQRRLESLLQVYGVNREIITLGFAHPELFQVLHGKKADPLVEIHYLQLWLNQMALIHDFNQRRFLSAEMLEGVERDIRDFMTQENMRQHWKNHRQFYPESFQAYVDRIAEGKAGVHEERPPRKRRFRRR